MSPIAKISDYGEATARDDQPNNRESKLENRVHNNPQPSTTWPNKEINMVDDESSDRTAPN